MGSIPELYKIQITSIRTRLTHEHLESVHKLEVHYTPYGHLKSRLIVLKKMMWDSKKITHAHLLKIIHTITVTFKEIPFFKSLMIV